MDAVTPITNPQRLLPNPSRDAAGARPEPTAPASRPRSTAASRPAVWTLPREVAQAACAAQMIAPQRRGLKADAGERARYARAYARRNGPPAGLMLKETA